MTESDPQSEIDDLIERFFRAFDNRDGRVPTLPEVASHFTEKASIVHSRTDGIVVNTVEEFALPRVELLSSGQLVDFHEWETESTTQILGPLATRLSRYEKTGMLDGALYTGAGSKIFNLARIESGWRLTSFSWIDDES